MPIAILDSYIAANERRHRDLERLIEEEAARPRPDSLRLQSLKRKKLRFKELCLVVQRRRDLASGRIAA